MDNVIAVMEANHLHLTMQKSFYVEISRARHRAELVTDDAEALRERLEAATGERVSALEGIRAETEKPAIQHKADAHGRGAVPGSPAEGLDERQTIRSISEPAPNRSNTNLICSLDEYDDVVQSHQIKSEKLSIGRRNL